MVTRRFLAVVAVGAVWFAGCGKMQNAANRSKSMNDLKELGMAYLNFQDAENHPPKSYEELTKKFPLPPGCAKATVFWGAGMGGKCKDGAASEVVIAHMTSPGGKDVLALMCDASVKVMTQQEFDSAVKAKPLPR
jgi:hypothetical protein